MSAANLPLIAARALHFWAVATLLGGAAFVLRLRHPSHDARRLLRIAAIAAALSGLAWFAWVFAGVMGGTDGFLDIEDWQAFLAAPFGLPWAIRVALCLIAIGLAARPYAWLGLALGLAFALDQAWLGHVAAAEGPHVLLQFALYWLHVAAGFLWTGALVMLCALSWEALRVPLAGLTLFSTIGTAVVATIVTTGLVNAALRGVKLADLAASPYGQLIIVKIALLVAMVALALVNRRNEKMRVDRVAASLGLETALGLAVLAAAAALGVTPPPGASGV